jgi:hypothetical protein
MARTPSAVGTRQDAHEEPPPPVTQRPSPRSWLAFHGWWPLLAAAAVLFGSVVRLRQYLSGRSLWMDEASITMNVLQRSPGRLMRPLGLFQAAPAGWLWAEKAATGVFGDSEESLRLVSLAGGLLVLVLTWDVARRAFGQRAAAVATVLVAVSPALIRYSNEVKQYSSDAACIMVILDVAMILSCYRSSRVPWRRIVVFGALISAACFVSQAAVLVAVLVLPVLMFWIWPVSRVRALALVGIGSIGGLLQYVTTIRYLTDSQAHRSAVRWFYPPMLPNASILDRLLWLPGGLIRLAHDPFGAPVALLLGFGVVLATVTSRPEQRRAVLLLCCPLVIEALAVLDYGYPLGGRFSLNLIPPTLILCCAPLAYRPASDSFASDRTYLGIRWTWVAGAAAVVLGSLLLSQLPKSIRLFVTPQTVTEIRPVLEQVKAQRYPGEAVIPYAGADGQYVYYAGLLGGLPLTGESLASFDGACFNKDLYSGLQATGRFWFVYTVLSSATAPGNLHDGDSGTEKDIAQMLRTLGGFGHITRRIPGTHAGAVEIVMSRAPYRIPPPGTHCIVNFPLPTHI